MTTLDPLAQLALDRLRDPDGDALAGLARLVVEETTATPLKALASPRWIAGQLTTALEAGTRGDMLRHWVDRRIASERERWSTEERTPRSLVPPEAEEPLRKLLGRAYAPNETLMLRIIDQPAIRNLLRVVLTDTVAGFRKRAADVDTGVFGGIGKRAAARGRGLFGNVGRNLGGMAEHLVEAVKEEVDWALDGRVKDFVQGAVTEAVRKVAHHLSDPAHQEQFAEMRLAILDVVLDTPIKDLANEADKMKPEDMVDVVVAAVRSAVSAEDFVDRAEERVAKLMEEAGDGTFGAWLDEIGLRQVWTETTTELVTERLRAVVTTDGFVTWWGELFRR